jgi:hypothetical protein
MSTYPLSCARASPSFCSGLSGWALSACTLLGADYLQFRYSVNASAPCVARTFTTGVRFNRTSWYRVKVTRIATNLFISVTGPGIILPSIGSTVCSLSTPAVGPRLYFGAVGRSAYASIDGVDIYSSTYSSCPVTAAPFPLNTVADYSRMSPLDPRNEHQCDDVTLTPPYTSWSFPIDFMTNPYAYVIPTGNSEHARWPGYGAFGLAGASASADWSIEAWLQLTAPALLSACNVYPSPNAILTFGDNLSSSAPGWSLYLCNNGIHFRWSTGSAVVYVGPTRSPATVLLPAPDSTWHQAFVQKVGNAISLFWDGELWGYQILSGSALTMSPLQPMPVLAWGSVTGAAIMANLADVVIKSTGVPCLPQNVVYPVAVWNGEKGAYTDRVCGVCEQLFDVDFALS